MIGRSVRVAVVVASYPLLSPLRIIRDGDGTIRLTVVVGVVVSVMVGLIASGRLGVVSAVVAVALPEWVGKCFMAGWMGTYLAVGTGAGHVVTLSAGSG